MIIGFFFVISTVVVSLFVVADDVNFAMTSAAVENPAVASTVSRLDNIRLDDIIDKNESTSFVVMDDGRSIGDNNPVRGSIIRSERRMAMNSDCVVA